MLLKMISPTKIISPTKMISPTKKYKALPAGVRARADGRRRPYGRGRAGRARGEAGHAYQGVLAILADRIRVLNTILEKP